MTQFEIDFSEMMEPLTIGHKKSTQSSAGHMTETWETLYNTQGIVQVRIRTNSLVDLSADTQVEFDALVLLPLQTSSGEDIQLRSDYILCRNSSYSSDADLFEMKEYDTRLDYCLHAKARRFERG